MMCQVYNRCSVKFLPVHAPTDAEAAARDVPGFAQRVRVAVADGLGVPLTNHNFLDTLLNRKAALLRLPVARFNLGMGGYPDGLDHAKHKLEEFALLDEHRTGALGPAEFAKLLGLDDGDDDANLRVAEAVIAQWDRDGDGKINFREFLLFSAWRKVQREHQTRLSRQGSNVAQPDAATEESLREPGAPAAGAADEAPASDEALDANAKEDQELRYAFAMVFGSFDTDHDGIVTKQQFFDGVALIAPSIDPEATLAPVFAAVDTEGAGSVSLEQYMRYAERHPALICALLNALDAPATGVSRESSVTFEAESAAAMVPAEQL
jgi:Ca2+-binding EF-hand superfamily protein